MDSFTLPLFISCRVAATFCKCLSTHLLLLCTHADSAAFEICSLALQNNAGVLGAPSASNARQPYHVPGHSHLNSKCQIDSKITACLDVLPEHAPRCKSASRQE